MTTDSGWPYIFSAVGGGAVTYIIKPLFHTIVNKPKQEFEEAARIRSELRENVDDLRDEVNNLNRAMGTLQGEIDSWRGKYYAVLEANLDLQHQCNELLAELHRSRGVPIGDNLHHVIQD